MDLGRLRRLAPMRAARPSNGSALPIAVEFGASALKVLQIAAGDPPTMVAAATLDTPDDLIGDPAKRLAFQIEALPGLFRTGAFRGRRAVCGIPAGHTVVKHMQIAPIQGVTLAQSAEQALALQLGCAPGSILVRHVEVEAPGRAGGGPKSEVICIAAARNLIEGLMRSLKEAKLEPVGIHSEPLATLRAFDHINRRDNDQSAATLYLDIGAQTTNVVIGHGRELVFARKIDFGGHTLDVLLHKQTGCSLGDARVRRLSSEELSAAPPPKPVARASRPARVSTGIPALDAFVQSEGASPEREARATVLAEERREGRSPVGLTGDVLRQPEQGAAVAGLSLGEPLEIFADEISMCLRYHASTFPETPLSRAIFLGGESRHLGLCQHVARAIRLPSQVADPMARVVRTGEEMVVGVDFTAPQPGWAVPLGLCLCPTDL